MSFKTPILCDRRIYDKRGIRKNYILGIEETFFYFVREPLTIIPDYSNGREEVKESTTICVYGEKPFIKGDNIILENGHIFKVVSITLNYAEINVLVKDLLKPRVESIDLVLE